MSSFQFPWDETFPLDSQTANLLGSDLRRVLVQVRERLGDLTGVSFANDTSTTPAFSYLRVSGQASSYLIPGSTQFSIKNNAASQDNWIITDAGNISIRGTIIPIVNGGAHLGSASNQFGNLNLQGEIFFYQATAKIVGGATSLSLRNNADTQDNLLVNDNGAVSIRNGLTVLASGINSAGAIAVTASGNISTPTGDIYTNSGQVYGSAIAANSGASYTINWESGNILELTLQAAPVSLGMSNFKTGAIYYLSLIQDATGNRTVNWPVNIKWPNNTAPSLSTAAGAKDLVTLVVGASNIYGYLDGAHY